MESSFQPVFFKPSSGSLIGFVASKAVKCAIYRSTLMSLKYPESHLTCGSKGMLVQCASLLRLYHPIWWQSIGPALTLPVWDVRIFSDSVQINSVTAWDVTSTPLPAEMSSIPYLNLSRFSSVCCDHRLQPFTFAARNHRRWPWLEKESAIISWRKSEPLICRHYDAKKSLRLRVGLSQTLHQHHNQKFAVSSYRQSPIHHAI